MVKPRVSIAMLGIDQHEVGAIAVACLLRDAGMEVIYAGCYNTPATLIRMAIDEDVDVIGISCHSWEYLESVPELMAMVSAESLDAAVVLGGSVITAGDADAMRQLGVAAIFGPDAGAEQMIQDIRRLAETRQRKMRDGKPVVPGNTASS